MSVGARLQKYWRLRHFDGPLLAGFSRLWLLQTVWSGRAHLEFWDVVCKYGMDMIWPFPHEMYTRPIASDCTVPKVPLRVSDQTIWLRMILSL